MSQKKKKKRCKKKIYYCSEEVHEFVWGRAQPEWSASWAACGPRAAGWTSLRETFLLSSNVGESTVKAGSAVELHEGRKMLWSYPAHFVPASRGRGRGRGQRGRRSGPWELPGLPRGAGGEVGARTAQRLFFSAWFLVIGQTWGLERLGSLQGSGVSVCDFLRDEKGEWQEENGKEEKLTELLCPHRSPMAQTWTPRAFTYHPGLGRGVEGTLR